MPAEGFGRIITFYSYKGGTGRTMALANAAWILASAGHRVLMIDWDLEAPGLHRYFHPFLNDKTLVSTKGVIDMVFEYQRTILAQQDAMSMRELADEWYDEHTDVFRYISELDWGPDRQPGFGELHLLPAGQQTVDYGVRVNTFNWRQLYDNLGGHKFIESVKRQLTREYDYILVDSRTGVSDTSGLCTVQMPHALVVCFTLNTQSIEGASEVAVGVREQRESGLDMTAHSPDGSHAPTSPVPFRVYPVPMRVEKAEKQKLDLARDAARLRFDTFVSWMPPAERERYWGSVEIFYEPFYAYEEVLATVADKPGAIASLLASLERLVKYIAGDDVRMPSVPESLRQEILALYERRRSEPDDPDARATALLHRFTTEDADHAKAILLRVVEPGVGGSIVRRTLATSDVAERGALERLVDEGILSRKLGEDETEYVTLADERLLNWPTLRGWVREQEEILSLRPALEHLALQWEREERSASLLLVGDALARAGDAVNDHRALFSPRAARFVKAGERERERQHRDQSDRARAERARRDRTRDIAVRAAAAAVLAIMVVVAVVLYVIPWWRDRQIVQSSLRKTNAQDGLVYVWIPPGVFQMGCSYDASLECRSVPVRLTRGFWIGQTEVTNAAYRRHLTARNAPADDVPPDNMPARGLNWLDAVDYCARAGGRLPTEAEWEYAARGGERARRYVTGDTLDEEKISLGMAPRPVGSYSPNGFGVFDMTGNVAEWTRSRGNTLYDYYGLGSYSDAEPLVDPEFEPRPGEPIVVRGGSYSSISRELQLHYGTLSQFDTQEETIGLRCVLEGSELEMVAAAYRINPFFEPYNAYNRSSPYWRGSYQSWWYSLYLRYLGVEQWHRSQ